MSVAETMQEWMERLPENNKVFEAKSRAQILADLELSRRQIDAGQTLDFDQALDEIASEYGL